MLLRRDPCEAYRRVDFDARVTGADSRQLVDLCLEQLTGSIGRAIYAEGRGDNGAKSAALTRATAALTALQLGVDSTNPTGPALIQLYQSARKAVLDCAVRFDAVRLETIRADFLEIRQAMLGAPA
ncbi:flagellar protein FliS [Novosphingobium sp. KCTC 2891]|uniref:flagellar protein FliS n=1 Tax=Novosphingobium sp. KCTC 2891 TaxID=2989730 RepID=UPI0022231B58|nr:flagellar protein FliS [Novosphingobium sp. KCTC 2891]MCW1383022.1 flagellar protein FliS [Novosphingobium sp. KCTC 2891]